jgi:multidrug efflux pump
MQYMPLTLIIVLTSSLFVALVINPVITSRFMQVDKRSTTPEGRRRRRRNVLIGSLVMAGTGLLGWLAGMDWLRNLMGIALAVSLFHFYVLRPAAFRFQNNFMPRLENAYDRFVRWALGHAKLIFFGTFGLLFLSIALLGVRAPKVEFFPSADPLYVNAFVELPLGADIEATNRIVTDLEQRIIAVVKPYGKIVEAVLTQIGENTSDPNSPPEPGSSPHKARLTVSFVPAQHRDGISTFDIMEEIRAKVKGIPGVAITVDKNADGPATGKPINIEIQGEDIDRLVLLGEEVIDYIDGKNIPGIEELQADIKIGKPELIVNVDRESARRYEVSTGDIATAIRTAVFGREVSKYKVNEDEYPIIIRLGEEYRYNVDELLNQRITFRSPVNGEIVQVPISAVADVRYSSSYSAIKRKDLDRMVTIYSNVLEGYNANEIIAEIDEALRQYDMPAGFSYEFTGEQQQQAEDMSFLFIAFLTALFTIFLILVAQFNSISSPFIIVLSVLFSTIGVFLGYVIFNQNVSVVFTGVGIISLAGVVVNNAIVLIDYTKLLLKRKRMDKGLEREEDLELDDVRESIVRGGATRLRPVLLTAITTILGLVPLAIGFNFDFFSLISELDPHIFIGGDNAAFWGPMAWTVIYGLTFATFLTLVVVPIMFWLAFRMKQVVGGWFGRGGKPAVV